MYLDYVVKRFGVMLLVVFLAVTINFALPRLMPGDPIESQLNQLMAQGAGSVGDIEAMVAAYRERFGLDQPLIAQYFAYWNQLFHLELGFSLANYPERVGAAIMAGLPWTLGLLGFSTLVSFAIGTKLGGLIAWPKASRLWRVPGTMALILSSVPYFMAGMILLYVFAVILRWFPAGGGLPYGIQPGFNLATLEGVFWHGALPALSIIIAETGAWAVGMRGMLISTLGEDHIALAEAKGLKDDRIFRRYGMRTAMLPQLTKLALTLGHIVSGAILVEVIFSYPGIGFRLYQAIQSKDYFVIQGIVLVLSVSLAVATFILDLIYPLIDPRISTKRRG